MKRDYYQTSQDAWDILHHRTVRYCGVCGKELTSVDTDYYDLSSYCHRCAVADGILSE